MAIKVIRPEYANVPGFRERFALEISAAQSVSGAYTAALIESDPYGDPPWMATVYVPGPSLWEAVRAHGLFSETQARMLGAGIAEALRTIHAAEVVHRDLKPANVLLAREGPTVIDFGISRTMGRPGVTAPGNIIGTPAYMAPEQITRADLSPAADVFALASVLVFAIAGRPPFGEEALEAVLHRIVHEEPDLSGVPHGLRGLVARCLSKRPEARPDLDGLLGELLAELEDTRWEDLWQEDLADDIGSRTRESGEEPVSGTGPEPVDRSLLARHVFALLDAGLTDEMVREAAGHGRR